MLGHRRETYGKISLAALAWQNSTSLILLHNLQSDSRRNGSQFDLVVAIAISEALKLCCSLLCSVRYNSRSEGLLLKEFLTGHLDAAIPAVAYTTAILCQSMAAKRLDLVLYVMLSQTKLVFTPVFASIFLRQSFARRHWICLVLMATGIFLMQLGPSPHVASITHGSTIPGVAFMLAAGSLVSFAGVHIEATVKGSKGFWVLQSQLSAYSCIAACLVLAWKKKQSTATPAIVSAWEAEAPWWLFIVLQALGGPLVGWCVRITNTTAKNYAQGLGFLIAAGVGLYTSSRAHPQAFYCGMAILLASILWCLYMTMTEKRDDRDQLPSLEVAKLEGKS